MPDVNVYPHDVVVPITPKLRGRSFFPGGCGLFGGVAQRLADRPIMLVGQDFGTLDCWNGLNTDNESWQRTSTSLGKLLTLHPNPTKPASNGAFMVVRS